MSTATASSRAVPGVGTTAVRAKSSSSLLPTRARRDAEGMRRGRARLDASRPPPRRHSATSRRGQIDRASRGGRRAARRRAERASGRLPAERRAGFFSPRRWTGEMSDARPLADPSRASPVLRPPPQAQTTRRPVRSAASARVPARRAANAHRASRSSFASGANGARAFFFRFRANDQTATSIVDRSVDPAPRIRARPHPRDAPGRSLTSSSLPRSPAGTAGFVRARDPVKVRATRAPPSRRARAASSDSIVAFPTRASPRRRFDATGQRYH